MCIRFLAPTVYIYIYIYTHTYMYIYIYICTHYIIIIKAEHNYYTYQHLSYIIGSTYTTIQNTCIILYIKSLNYTYSLTIAYMKSRNM
jgi:hypothetical protein